MVKWRDKSGCWKSEETGAWCESYEAIPLADGKERYCVFHAPQGEKGVSLEEFNDLVYAEIDKARAEGSPVVFEGTEFEGEISFSRYSKEDPLPSINFCLAVFHGPATFDGTHFSGEASFEKTVFEKEASFREAVFECKIDICNATFLEEADFTSASFRQQVYISWGSFKKGAKLDKVHYGGRAVFMRPIV